MATFLTAAVLVVAAAFRGMTGFGFALIAIIGLSPLYPANLLAPLVIASDLMLTGLILREGGRSPVDRQSLALMLVFGLAGAALGPLVAGRIDDETAKLMIGLAVFAAALAAMVKRPPAFLGSTGMGIAAALAVGFMLSAFAAGGPIIVAWLIARNIAADRFRGTLAVFFGLIDMTTLLTRFAYGTVPEGFFAALSLFLPASLAGYGAGLAVFRRLSPGAWRALTRHGLVFIALAGALRAGLSAWRL